jgi:hypothetical protein
MKCPTKVNCPGTVIPSEPKTLTGSIQIGDVVGCFTRLMKHTDNPDYRCKGRG